MPREIYGLNPLLDISETSNLILPGAINIDVTEIDPDSPHPLPLDQFLRGHAWPYIWYRDYTMLSGAEWSYGFHLSREYGSPPGGAQSPVPTKNSRTGIPSHGSREFRRGTRLCFEAPPGPAVDCSLLSVLSSQVDGLGHSELNAEYEQTDIVDFKANAVPNPWLAGSRRR